MPTAGGGRAGPALRQLFPWPLLYLQHCVHICFPLCLFPCRWEPGFKSLLSTPAARRGFRAAQHAPFGWVSKSRLQAWLVFFFLFFFSLFFFFFILLNLPALPHLLSLPPFWPQSYLGSGNMFRHLVAGSAGLWQRLAACSSPIGKGRRAGPRRRGSTRPTLAMGDVPVAACTAPAWPVAFSSPVPVAIPPHPASPWRCLEFWLRPTSGFAGDLDGRKAQLCTAAPRSCALSHAFRTRHRHLRPPSPAESTAPEHGNFGRARQQNPPGSKRSGHMEGCLTATAHAVPPDPVPLSDCNLSTLSKKKKERALSFPQPITHKLP